MQQQLHWGHTHTQRLQGFCYVTYSTTEAAAAALERFHAMECPPNSGHRLKVQLAFNACHPPVIACLPGISWRLQLCSHLQLSKCDDVMC